MRPPKRKRRTDGTAQFSLPAPGTYTIWARPLGTPNGFASLTTCAGDVAGNGSTTDEVCSTEHEVFVRGSGKVGSFKDVTTNLTTILIDPVLDAAAVTACGSTTVGPFDPCLENYLWEYDNSGLRVLQCGSTPAPEAAQQPDPPDGCLGDLRHTSVGIAAPPQHWHAPIQRQWCAPAVNVVVADSLSSL